LKRPRLAATAGANVDTNESSRKIQLQIQLLEEDLKMKRLLYYEKLTQLSLPASIELETKDGLIIIENGFSIHSHSILSRQNSDEEEQNQQKPLQVD
jgi:hypothetical protein